MALKVNNLSIGYSGFPLASHISFELKAGEVLTITGQNGIGKSSLLSTIAGVIPPLSGTIQNHLNETTFLSICKPFYPTLTIKENLQYLAHIGGGKLEDIEIGLSYFKLSTLQDAFISHLSAGQLQRLHLATLFVMRASLWLLDEPTRSLDERGEVLFYDLLKTHLHAGGVAIIAQPQHTSFGFQLSLNDLNNTV